MSNANGTSNERTQDTGEDSGLPVMPEVVELDAVTDAAVMAALQEFNARLSGYFQVRPDDAALSGRRLGMVEGRLVYFRENEPSYVGSDMLLMGLVAASANGSLPLSNPDRLDTDGVRLMRTIQERLRGQGIDLSAADQGETIELSALSAESKQAADAILAEELARATEQGPVIVQWLRHGGVNSTGQRVLKSDVLRIGADESGEVTVERNPHKRLSVLSIEQAFQLDSPRRAHVTELIRLQKGGTKLDEAQQAELTAYRTMEASARRAMLLALHRPFGVVREPEPPRAELDGLQRQFARLPQMFEAPLDTIQAGYEIDQIRQHVLDSGAWIFQDEALRLALHDEQAFARYLSERRPNDAREVLRQLVAEANYYANASLPAFTWGVQGVGSPWKGMPAVQRVDAPATRTERASTLGQLFNLPSTVLPSSVLGVAHALGLTQSGQVYRIGERSHQANSVLVYGTTDYSNMAEMIQTWVAARAGGREIGSVYFADSSAHPIGSYVRRILAPTIVALYNLDEAAERRLLERAHRFDEVFDADLGTVIRELDCPELTQHIASVEAVIGRQATFAGLYRALNEHFARQFGVQYRDTQELFEASNMTVGQLAQHIAEVAKSTEVAYAQVAQQLRDAGVPEKRIEGMLQSLFGASGAWGADKKFLRSSSDKTRVNIAELPPETRLADLRDLGITLGGNAWAVLMRVLDFGQPITIVGDKNTALGGNYAGSVVGDPTTQICVTPIVRVVPDGNAGSKGDGLDITAYVLHPDLIAQVAQALTDQEENVRGGQSKMVVEVKTRTVWLRGRQERVTTYELSREPTTGGNRQQVRIGLI